jgi:hypothetical protein
MAKFLIDNFLFVLFVSVFLSGCVSKPVATAEVPYRRSDWEHWIDEDGNCRDTRVEVLLRDSRSKVRYAKKGCKIVSGEWEDFYTGEVYRKASLVDIDHVVSLKEAHDSGGARWSTEDKRRFANDTENLVVTGRWINRDKGAKSPRDWLPAQKERACRYLQKWLGIKKKYQLSVDSRDRFAVQNCIP